MDSHDLTVAGLTQMLANPARYEIVQAGCASPPPDVLLYSVDDSDGGHDPELHALVRRGTSTVVVVHWEDSAPGVAAALACGAHGAVSLKLAAADLLDEVEKVRLGSEPGTEPPSRGSCHPEIARAGLTPRELDALALVAAGLTNQEIADRLFISINTVKTYLRTAYQKIGAERRSQAVIWVERHGLTRPVPAPVPVPGHAEVAGV